MLPSKDILDTEEDLMMATFALKITQHYMIRGKIWQEVLASYKSCINLDNNKLGYFVCGFDIIDLKKKFAMEVKNKYNTTNASGLLMLKNKLAQFKITHPRFRVIHGIVNAKGLKSYSKTISHYYKGQNVEIEVMAGMDLFKFVLGDDCDRIIDFVKKEVKKYGDTTKILNYIKTNV